MSFEDDLFDMPDYVRMSQNETMLLLDKGVMEKAKIIAPDGSVKEAVGAVRTVGMHDVVVFSQKGKPQDDDNLRNYSGAMTSLAGNEKIAQPLPLEPFTVSGAPPSFETHKYTAPPSLLDLSRAFNTVLLAPSDAMPIYAIGTCVGFPGCALNGDTLPEQLVVDAVPEAPEFTNELLRKAAVVWAKSDREPRLALVQNVAVKASTLDTWLAALEEKQRDDSAALSEHENTMQCIADTRAAIADVMRAIERGRPSADKLQSKDKWKKLYWNAINKAVGCTRDTLVFEVAMYTLWPETGDAVRNSQSLFGMIKGDGDGRVMRAATVANDNRAVVRIDIQVPQKPGVAAPTLCTEFKVPIVNHTLYQQIVTKQAREAEAAKAAKKGAVVASPKKAPIAADVAKLTPANTEKAMTAELGRQLKMLEQYKGMDEHATAVVLKDAKKKEGDDDDGGGDDDDDDDDDGASGGADVQTPAPKSPKRKAKRKSRTAADNDDNDGGGDDDVPQKKTKPAPKKTKAKAKKAVARDDDDGDDDDDDDDDDELVQTPKKAKTKAKETVAPDDAKGSSKVAQAPKKAKAKAKAKKPPVLAIDDDDDDAPQTKQASGVSPSVSAGAGIVGDFARSMNCHRLFEMSCKFEGAVATGKLKPKNLFGVLHEVDLSSLEKDNELHKAAKVQINHFLQVLQYTNLAKPFGELLRAAHGTAPVAEDGDSEGSDSMPDIW